jgi:putative DNA primase/helicase
MSTVDTVQEESRKFSIVVYANETVSIGKQVAGTWQQVVALLGKRDIRQEKSGNAFAPVQMLPGAARAKGNVLGIYMAVADIDTEGVKDKATGRVLSVSKRAPPFDELRPNIWNYAWAAHSSHWHEPQRGIIKYRIVFPLARPCSSDEWPQVWEGLNILLRGHCDTACRDVSRLYYLPSCPAESESHAFFEANDGVLLDPDMLIGLARSSNVDHLANVPSNLQNSISHLPPPDTPENVQRVKSMLAVLSANCSYAQWRDTVWAIAATGWSCAEALAREWSQTASHRFDEDEFRRVFQSFKPDGGVRFGTLVHHARQAGWLDGHLSAGGVLRDSSGDILNGSEFANRYRNQCLFLRETDDLLKFEPGTGWVMAHRGEADCMAKCVVEQMRSIAAERWKGSFDDPKVKAFMRHVERSSNLPGVRAMIEMARSEPGMARSVTDFDADPMRLGLTNGVLDLNSRQLLPVSPDCLVSKRCNIGYDPTASCPQWDQFLVDVQPDPAIRDFLQRWVGYCLTGSVLDHKLVFLHGGGANGKSVFVELLAWLLGDYAKKIATEMLMQHQRNPQAASPDIVSLKGMRFVYANETEEGRKLAEARVKELTGGDTLTGRVLYARADITFSPTHKLILVGNHKPEIGDTSNGMWRRMCLVPFDVTIPPNQRDPKLLEKLKREASGILNWALTGLLKYRQGGLSIPSKIDAATAAYRDEQDIIGDWINDHCKVGASLKMKKDEAYRAYQKWCIQNGHRSLAKQRFTRRLGERNYPLLPDKRTMGGLELNPDGAMAALS